ncbi:MAG: MBL fold metallo-hydrolase, partial [Atribacterota bacterium]|nr:MBL fold metallo-hydrolase [Atribacterota bacterium]
QAEPSHVTKIIKPEGLIIGTPLKSFPLEGHFLQMIGLKTPDNIFFIADSLFSEEIIGKYKITFRTNIEKSLKTYTFLEKEKAQLFIPSHAEPTDNLNNLIDVNRGQIKEINQKILKYCSKPATREDIIANLVEDFRLQLSAIQYVLINTSISAHISYLNENQLLDFKFIENKMYWESTDISK